MEKLHLALLKVANWILASMLVLMGFSCTDESGDEPIPCEYGVPYAHFQVKGKVKDKAGNPVSDIQIRIFSKDSHDYWMYNDTVYADKDGTFEWKKTGFPLSNYTFITEDPDDSPDRPRFTSDTTTLTFKREDFVGGEKWFEGLVEKEIDITLKEYVDPHTQPYALYTIYGKVIDTNGYPLPGILIQTNPSYTANQENDPESYPAITDLHGNYRFTYDKATTTEHMIYASVYTKYWNYPDACSQDSVAVDFAEIKLSDGKGMLTGKGSKEVNFQLKRKY